MIEDKVVLDTFGLERSSLYPGPWWCQPCEHRLSSPWVSRFFLPWWISTCWADRRHRKIEDTFVGVLPNDFNTKTGMHSSSLFYSSLLISKDLWKFVYKVLNLPHYPTTKLFGKHLTYVSKCYDPSADCLDPVAVPWHVSMLRLGGIPETQWKQILRVFILIECRM